MSVLPGGGVLVCCGSGHLGCRVWKSLPCSKGSSGQSWMMMATGDAGLILLGRIREIMNAMKVMMVRERIHGAGAGLSRPFKQTRFDVKRTHASTSLQKRHPRSPAGKVEFCLTQPQRLRLTRKTAEDSKNKEGNALRRHSSLKPRVHGGTAFMT